MVNKNDFCNTFKLLRGEIMIQPTLIQQKLKKRIFNAYAVIFTNVLLMCILIFLFLLTPGV
tara:strand:- start:18 stop:200 length:183 start_codon:yes stop_codon:yes gene_type:complete